MRSRLLFSTCYLLAAAATATSGVCLAPGSERLAQYVSYGVPLSYCLEPAAFGPSTAFEVKLSVPASQPTRLTLALVSADGSGALEVQDEKVSFHTDSAGRIVLPSTAAGKASSGVPSGDVLFRVSAAAQSVAHGVHRAGAAFNMNVDTVHLGFIPSRALHLIPGAIAVVVVGAVAVRVLHQWLSRNFLVAKRP